MASINATMRALGMRQSTLGRRMQGRHGITGEQENWVTPDEYAELVATLLHGRAASAASCQAMLVLLEDGKTRAASAGIYLKQTSRVGVPRLAHCQGSPTMRVCHHSRGPADPCPILRWPF